MTTTILGIESSCDDTSAAVIKDGVLLSNILANQDIHKAYGGVVPELASRAHQQNIIPVVDQAIKKADISLSDIDAIAFTKGPGLLGSLLVGTSFAKGFSIARDIPMIDINHLQGHVLAHFVKMEASDKVPEFPFLCLLVSGGHTQIIIVKNYLEMEVIGNTLDDAAGEAFDKCAKILGLDYPGGPIIDKLAQSGNSNTFKFSKPKIPELDYSFSGLKTAFLYFLRDQQKIDPDFIRDNKADICASLQHTIINILFDKLIIAIKQTGINTIALSGGVAANSGLRDRLTTEAMENGWEIFLPNLSLTTDNAAMIAITGYFKYLNGEFSNHNVIPQARYQI